MKTCLWFCMLTIIWSCRAKSVEIIYSSNQNDTPTELDANQVFKLKKQAANADFDTLKLAAIDHYTKDSLSLRRIFEPVNGEYNYYQFQSTYKGRALLFPEEDLKDSIRIDHDILILKTDKKNKIIDAYHYTLEWGEKPVKYDLFRSSVAGLALADGMNISDSKFLRTEFRNEDERLLQEKGEIELK